MGRHHYVAEESWAVINLDTLNGQVLVCEKWLYDWKLWPGVSAAWTYEEKKNFHSTCDQQIWSIWSFRVTLFVTGPSQFARSFRSRKLTVNFDIKWWLDPHCHWKVTAWKMPPGTSPTALHRSFVDVPGRRIELNTADIAPRGAGNAAGRSTTAFRTVPHEYGHAMVAPGGFTANPDEYKSSSPHLHDTLSMMNIGQQLRERHLAATVSALNRLAARTPALSGSVFTVATIK